MKLGYAHAPLRLAGLALISTLLASASAQAEVFKCRDAEGNVSYGETPCKGQQRLPYTAGSVTTIEAPPRRPSPPVETSAAEATAPSDDDRRAPRTTPNPNLPAGVNCNVDNPDYDPAFCNAGNLRSLYGPQPAHPAPTARH
ncbi:DUF4124 domain-containing protein [Amantichitinum ursilacus]|uniref:DUF4124 domain-containing protein n=1 Tax=Amantichitinum ursilacus TaxID=857265 RepID=A0A0N0GQX8_9NEIS|nr:DUF4124 domain-containing protein [Amantichitinum ursilacus]KPC55151.1 hypothetical protein WG78_00790 [Amantichitinum ursilacus]